MLENAIIRSLPQALYQPLNIGHFGLALAEYAHFTSPIRRYPDLLVHRGIRHALGGGTADGLRAFGARDGDARHGVLAARASRRRGGALGRRLAQVRVHAPAHRRGVRRSRDRRRRVRRVRAVEADCRSTGWCTSRRCRATTSISTSATARSSASARNCASRSGTNCASGSCGWIPPSGRSTSSTSRRPRLTTIRDGAPASRPPGTSERLARLRVARGARGADAPARGCAAACPSPPRGTMRACASFARSRRRGACGRPTATTAALDQETGGAAHQGVVAEVRPSAPLDENSLLDLLTAQTLPALVLVLDGVSGSAQPRGLPAHGRCGRRDRGRGAAGPRGRPDAGRAQGRGRRRGDHAVCAGDEPRAGAARHEGGGALDRGHGRRRRAGASCRRPDRAARDRHGVGRQGPAAPDPGVLRLHAAPADAGSGCEPQRLGGGRNHPLRGAAPARAPRLRKPSKSGNLRAPCPGPPGFFSLPHRKRVSGGP